MTLPSTSQPGTVGVLDRTMAILDAVEGGARNLSAVAERTGLPRPSAHRLLKAMKEHGLLTSVDGRGYRLGARLVALGASAARQLPLRDLAHPALERLVVATGESAQLYVRNGDRRVCVDAVESPNELRTIVAVGASLPLDRGSAGKVFLAWAPPHDRRGDTAPDPAEGDRLGRELATIRRRGWAGSVGEREPGVASVSAPVEDPGGGIVAAVSVSGPAERIGAGRVSRYAPAVLEAAAAIGAALGR